MTPEIELYLKIGFVFMFLTSAAYGYFEYKYSEPWRVFLYGVGIAFLWPFFLPYTIGYFVRAIMKKD